MLQNVYKLEQSLQIGVTKTYPAEQFKQAKIVQLKQFYPNIWHPGKKHIPDVKFNK